MGSRGRRSALGEAGLAAALDRAHTSPVGAGVARYWLLKSEPTVFGIKDLERVRREPWDGVRNYQARNHLRAMSPGDLCLFYHSNASPPGVAGLARVDGPSYADPTQFDASSRYYDPKSAPSQPRWWLVDVEYVETFPRLVGLPELRADPELAGMLVIRRGVRLSVQPVERKHFARVLYLAKANTQLPESGE